MRLSVLIWPLAGVSALLGAGEPVTGRVTDVTNAPLAGATVTFQMTSRPAEPIVVKTNREGFFEIKEAPDGTYWMEAAMRGFISVRYYPIRLRFPYGWEQDFRLPADEVYESDAPNKAHVAGELRLGEKPVAGARVCLSRRQQERVCTTTNRFGQYSLLVAPGVWQASVANQNSEVVWRQTLRLGEPGEHRDPIQIRLGAAPAAHSADERQRPDR